VKDGKSSLGLSHLKNNVVVFIPSFVLYCPLFPLVRTTIYYSEMLIFSSLMPFSRSKWSPHAAVHAFLYGGGCLCLDGLLLSYEVISPINALI
jgi:hypothetical protein